MRAPVHAIGGVRILGVLEPKRRVEGHQLKFRIKSDGLKERLPRRVKVEKRFKANCIGEQNQGGLRTSVRLEEELSLAENRGEPVFRSLARGLDDANAAAAPRLAREGAEVETQDGLEEPPLGGIDAVAGFAHEGSGIAKGEGTGPRTVAGSGAAV